jgi:predicted RNase H-like HicB family nuclease
MLYPVYVHVGDEVHAYGVTVPDFPGCFSAADDVQDLPRMVQEAIELSCEGEDMELPEPTPLAELANDPEYVGGVWMLIDVDTSRLETKAVRINITLPQGLLNKVDSHVKELGKGATRSGFLAQAARLAMGQ